MSNPIVQPVYAEANINYTGNCNVLYEYLCIYYFSELKYTH